MWSHVWDHKKHTCTRLICLNFFEVAVWIPVCVSVKYLSIWTISDETVAV